MREEKKWSESIPTHIFFVLFLGLNAFFSVSGFQLQKRKEREEQLEDVIQAYEKIHMEKSNLQRDLDKMVWDIIQSTTLCISFTQKPYGSLIHSFTFCWM